MELYSHSEPKMWAGDMVEQMLGRIRQKQTCSCHAQLHHISGLLTLGAHSFPLKARVSPWKVPPRHFHGICSHMAPTPTPASQLPGTAS